MHGMSAAPAVCSSLLLLLPGAGPLLPLMPLLAVLLLLLHAGTADVLVLLFFAAAAAALLVVVARIYETIGKATPNTQWLFVVP